MASSSKPPPKSGNKAKQLAKTIKNLPLLGLRLNKTQSFIYQARMETSRKSRAFRPPAQVVDPQAELQRREKLKAAHIPAILIRIGSWQFASVHEADLVGKFYFATRKLVWEVLANGLKNKIEIPWSDISAIRATIEENKPGILEIELHQPPTFYKETDPQPRHHSIWIPTDDFTGGQALSCRRHYLEFPSAALDKSYVKLLNSDRRLLELSQKGFLSSVETTSCMLQQLNRDENPPRSAITMPQAHQVLQNTYPPALTPQRRSYEAAIQEALLGKNCTPPMSELGSRLLENHRLENSQMTPWDQYSPHVREAGVLNQQTPAIMRNTQRRLFSDPNSSYHPSLPPAIHGTFPSGMGSPSTIGFASNGDAMGFRQEHNGYANSNGEFIIGPLEQNGNFTSLIGMRSAVGSASNSVATGFGQEHDAYANSSGQFITCPSEQNGTFTTPIGFPGAVGSASNGNAMEGYANSNGQLIFDPMEQSGFTSPTGSSAVGLASHGNVMGVGQEHDGYASSDGQFNFGPSVSEGQIYEQLAPWMRHQAYERWHSDSKFKE